MTKSSNNDTVCHLWFAFAVLFMLVFSVYSNTFEAAWHLDDFPNVVNNPKLHLTDLTSDSIVQTFFSRDAAFGPFYRPVACLTFAINWYLGQENVVGYHLVNISVHLITALFLFLVLINLYRAPNLVNNDRQHKYWIALFAAALWALNPIQTQAVTYIVQRMAAMAAMFYIVALYFYVKGRTGNNRSHRIFYYAGCAISYLLAVGAKENAITLPLALLIIDILFFQNLDSPKIKKTVTGAAVGLGLLMIVACAYLVVNAGDVSILKGYQHRSFTIGQRLLTEPRIMIFYLSLLFYPRPDRLSIEHDIILSNSLLEPWTTLAAILLIGFMIGIGLLQARKRPVVAFALIFYFVNNLIESSLLPLELVFEHRNYLPSLFLFWPIAAGLVWLMDYFKEENRLISRILISFMVLLVVGTGVSAYIRNMDWATEKTLWEDAIRKAPGRARPAYNLARYYAGIGQLDAAEQLYRRSLVLSASRPSYSRKLSLNGMASIYYRKQDYERASRLCAKALDIDPGFETARYNLVLALAKLERWEAVSDEIDRLLARRGNSKNYLVIKGELLLKQDKPAEALIYFRKAIRSSGRFDKKALLFAGISLNLIRQYHQAEWFFRQAKVKWPGDIRAHIYLIGTSMNAGHPEKTERYIDELVGAFNVHTLSTQMKNCFENYHLAESTREWVCLAVSDKLSKLSDKMARIGEL